MATKKDAVVEPVETAQPIVTETPTPARRGLRLGGIITGGVLAAALLFGGGVLLGVNLPDGGRPGPGFAQAQFDGQLPGGAMPQGERPQGGPQQGGPQQEGPQQGGNQPPQQQQDDN